MAVESANGPTKLQMALAIIVLRNKPRQTTPRDYILHLRAQVKQGEMPTATNKSADSEHPKDNGMRYIDGLSYWKERAKRAEEKIDVLQVEVAHLERASITQQTSPDTNGIPARGSTSKRKSSSSKSKVPSKRTKHSNSIAPQNMTGACEFVLEDLNALDGLGTAGEMLTVHLHSIHQLQRRARLDHQALCGSLVKIAEAIGSISLTICKYHDQPTLGVRVVSLDGNRSELSCIVGACARSFSSLLLCLGKIKSDVPRHLPSSVIYACVSMCDNILNSIAQSCRLVASKSPQPEPQEKSRQTKPKGSPKVGGPLGALTHLLYDLVSFLDKNDPFQREIFEGWLYVLIKRVGDRLYHCTFGHRRSELIRDDIAHTLYNSAANINKQQKIVEDLALKHEVRSIVTILKRAMALAPYHLNPRPANMKVPGLARTATNRTLPPPSKVPLIAQIQEKLQRTLVNCMFGEEDNDEFSSVLRKPAKSGRMHKEPVVDDNDVSAWFVKEVWTLVGWQLLGREDEW